MDKSLIVLLFIFILGFTHARKRDGNSRNAPSLSYVKSKEFIAAFRRAAVLAESNNNNNILKDLCYDENGAAKKCVVSEFGNIAIRKQVEASSTCGTPPNRYCNRVASLSGSKMRQCYICDANHIERMNPANYLIDSNQKSCWVSQTFNDSRSINEVSVVISLGKKYELTYIILPFCNKLPESMALYKSADHGKRWVPLQYYSSDCRGIYKLEENGIILTSNEQAAVCKNIYKDSNPYKNTRLPFSLVDGRPSAHNLEDSAVLRDWVTVTDVKVVFKRLSSPLELETGPEENFYSMSELTLGGRCKCNGHANKCVTDDSGSTRCQCEHNTAGADCDRCEDFYFDRPWKLATKEDANECVACNCNLHSSKCIFSSSLYSKSNKKSGGVCIKCRHNTEGVNCQKCTEGYVRDFAVPMSHNRACKACMCHPYGSRGRLCADNGQCLCKEGVTGPKCDRCKPGFTMTKISTSPCQKNPPSTRDTTKRNDSPQSSQDCGDCRSVSNKLDLRKYCRSVYAIKALIQNRENVENGWVRFAILIQYVYKKGSADSTRRVRRNTKYVYVLEDDLHCKCPKLRINKTYILVGSNEGKEGRDGLLLDRESSVIRYNSEYDKRVKFYKKEERRRSCKS